MPLALPGQKGRILGEGDKVAAHSQTKPGGTPLMDTALQTATRPPAAGLNCYRCHQPATAGQAPDSVRRKLCVECASLAAITLPQSPERRAAAPPELMNSPAWPVVRQYTQDGTLWQHQTEAIQKLLDGHNTVIATSTASGKTLVFQSYVLHNLASDPEATAIVLYPTKALANDQNTRWREACAAMGLAPDTVGQIDGNISTQYRDSILSSSRVVIMTPDVCHAWLIRRSRTPQVHRFLSGLRTIVIDEAHTYEGVFGSNSAYLFRRMASAAADAGNNRPPIYVAATATIEEPQGHLRKLTGHHFELVSEDDNGAPKHPRKLLHLPTGNSIDEKQHTVAKLIVSIIDADPDAQVIAFCDSRQGVERIVDVVDRKSIVRPYRSGYRADDRREIEAQLKENSIRAVVATSALELGIDMPDLSYGIQLDLPPSRKQLHQRLGRVGRSKPGTFILLAPPDRFSTVGDTLSGYYAKHVEPCQLYLNNEFITFAQALCLKEELAARNQPTHLAPAHCEWPQNFQQALRQANRTPPDHLASLSQASEKKPPHHAFSLRTTGEDNLAIIESSAPSGSRERTYEIGDISVSQAMQEAHPGAIYRHRGNPYRIRAWARRRDSHEPFITANRISETSDRTRPIMRETVHLDPNEDTIIAGRYEEGPLGCIGELVATVTESVEGFRTISNYRGRRPDEALYYRDTMARDPGMSRKQRRYTTTAVLLRIHHEYFTGLGMEPTRAREELAQALRRQLSYERSIAIQDIRATGTNITVATDQGSYLAEDSIVVYDNIFGGLGLIDHLYTNLEDYASSLNAARPDPEQESILLNPATVKNFIDWLSSLSGADAGEPPKPSSRNWWRVVAPSNSLTIISEEGYPERATVTGHLWEDRLVYILQTEEGQIQATENHLPLERANLEWTLWQPATGKYQDFAQD